MAEEIVFMGSLAGLKLAIFLIVLIYSFFIFARIKIKNMWLVMMALIFVVMAVGEFIHVINLDEIGEGNPPTVWPWIADFDNLEIFQEVLSLFAGLGILLFLRNIDKNIEEYK